MAAAAAEVSVVSSGASPIGVGGLGASVGTCVVLEVLTADLSLTESAEAGWGSGVGGLGVGGSGVGGFGADVRSCVGGVLGANVGEIPLNRKIADSTL